MKKLITIITLLVYSNISGQFLKEVYKDFLKYGTVYVAGDVNNPQMEVKDILLEQILRIFMVYQML